MFIYSYDGNDLEIMNANVYYPIPAEKDKEDEEIVTHRLVDTLAEAQIVASVTGAVHGDMDPAYIQMLFLYLS